MVVEGGAVRHEDGCHGSCAHEAGGREKGYDIITQHFSTIYGVVHVHHLHKPYTHVHVQSHTGTRVTMIPAGNSKYGMGGGKSTGGGGMLGGGGPPHARMSGGGGNRPTGIGSEGILTGGGGSGRWGCMLGSGGIPLQGGGPGGSPGGGSPGGGWP